jgi:hypothetical protein
MKRLRIRLRKQEMLALREVAAQLGRTVADVAREAIREAVLEPRLKAKTVIAIWDGRPNRTSADHDSIYDRGL